MMTESASCATPPPAATAIRIYDNYSIQELHDKYVDQSLTPLAYIQLQLTRLRAIEACINPVAQYFDENEILAQAQQSTDRYRKQCPLGIFDGIPITMKDSGSSGVKGVAIHKGSTLFKQMKDQSLFVVPESVPALDGVLRQGAILLCKTTVPEMCWKSSCSSLLHGITRNPFNPWITTGGSSGGAAALTAIGIGCLNFGTDGGGSIRIPAASCGVVGFCPSLKFGLHPPFPSLSHVGPLTRHVDDVRIYMQELQRTLYQKRVQYSGNYGKHAIRSGVKGLRIAVSKNLDGIIDFVDERVWQNILGSVQQLSSPVSESDGGGGGGGAIVEFIEPPLSSITLQNNPIESYLEAFNDIWYAVINYGYAAYVCEDNKHLVDPGILECIQRGEEMSIKRLIQALDYRAAVCKCMDTFMDTYDLLICPTLPILPIQATEYTSDYKMDGSNLFQSKHAMYAITCLFNLTEQPAISVNCGYVLDEESHLNQNRTPVGLQIIGRKYEDSLVLRAAHVLEQRMKQPNGNHNDIFQGRMRPNSKL